MKHLFHFDESESSLIVFLYANTDRSCWSFFRKHLQILHDPSFDQTNTERSIAVVIYPVNKFDNIG